MDKLTKKLHNQLLENPAIQINESTLWQLPVITYEVTFKRVKRSKMDILMKMMLLSFEQTDIRRAANLVELLLVDELFIADLLNKMQRMGLVRMEKECYKLTNKGQEQLKTGIIVEELEEEETFLSYSPVHDEFWPELTEVLPETKAKLPSFRYEGSKNPINKEQILQFLTEREPEIIEKDFQTIITEVTSFNEQKVEHIPFLEFQLYNKEQDIFYARVWNTWLNRWDDTVEKQIEEEERLVWREQWMAVNEQSD